MSLNVFLTNYVDDPVYAIGLNEFNADLVWSDLERLAMLRTDIVYVDRYVPRASKRPRAGHTLLPRHRRSPQDNAFFENRAVFVPGRVH
jgi:hypothetical protein